MTRPYWHYQDPLETGLQAQVSGERLMGHVRTIGAWERESGSLGEAQAYDYIERALESYGLAVERREIEAYISLPEEGRVILPGTVIDGLTHSFSPSTDPGGLEAEVVDVGEEIVVTRSSVKGFQAHPVEYNLGLWKTWLDK